MVTSEQTVLQMATGQTSRWYQDSGPLGEIACVSSGAPTETVPSGLQSVRWACVSVNTPSSLWTLTLI